MLFTSLAFAVVVLVIDGDVADWAGIPPIATDPEGDNSTPDSSSDINALLYCLAA